MALRLFEEQLVQFLVENVSFTYITWHFSTFTQQFSVVSFKVTVLKT